MTEINDFAPRPKSFYCSKTYTHAEGLSCCFRQWRAKDTHCRFLHGYALKITIVFGCDELDGRNWVMNFGGLKSLKQWLKDKFDHKCLVAKDDPMLSEFNSMAVSGLIQLNIVENVGCEMFAEMIYDVADKLAQGSTCQRVYVASVTVSEHDGNSATCMGGPRYARTEN